MNTPRKLRMVSLFSGIGAYERALKNLNIEFELLNYCEIDKKTSQCYSLIHDTSESKNLVDVANLKNIPDMDLLVYSPPCQDISSIGKHAGITKDTRTGLMWKVVDLIKDKSPKYFIMENVANLATKYKNILDDYVSSLENYHCYCEVLNAKDYGTPQNRRRLFLVGIRKDLNQIFQMPEKQVLNKTLRNYLEGVIEIEKDIAYTIRIGGRHSKIGNKHNWDGYRINGKDYFLSSKDCLRLMGFTNEDYEKLKNAKISEARIAKVAGNSIVVSVLEAIFKVLL